MDKVGEDFTGARGALALSSLMTKRILFAVAGFLGLCFSASAQQTRGLEPLSFDGSKLDRSSVRSPSFSLDDDHFFLSTAFGWTRPTADYLPTFDPLPSPGDAYQTRPGRSYPADDVVDLHAPDRIHFGGEVGVLYGKSSGRYGREDFDSYIVGTVGNEKFSITAGYEHLQSSFNTSRGRR